MQRQSAIARQAGMIKGSKHWTGYGPPDEGHILRNKTQTTSPQRHESSLRFQRPTKKNKTKEGIKQVEEAAAIWFVTLSKYTSKRKERKRTRILISIAAKTTLNWQQ